MKINIAITTFCLVCTGAIEVPYGQIFWLSRFHAYSFRLAAKMFAGSVHPNVHGLDTVTLIKRHVLGQRMLVMLLIHGVQAGDVFWLLLLAKQTVPGTVQYLRSLPVL